MGNYEDFARSLPLPDTVDFWIGYLIVSILVVAVFYLFTSLLADDPHDVDIPMTCLVFSLLIFFIVLTATPYGVIYRDILIQSGREIDGVIG